VAAPVQLSGQKHPIKASQLGKDMKAS